MAKTMAETLEGIVNAVSNPLALLNAKINKVERLFGDLQRTLSVSPLSERTGFPHFQ
jgi:hypothetical protein